MTSGTSRINSLMELPLILILKHICVVIFLGIYFVLMCLIKIGVFCGPSCLCGKSLDGSEFAVAARCR